MSETKLEDTVPSESAILATETAPVTAAKPKKAKVEADDGPVFVKFSKIVKAVEGEEDYDPRWEMPLDKARVNATKEGGAVWDKARPGILRRYPNGSLRFEDGRTRSRIFESLGADGGWFMVRNVATEGEAESGDTLLAALDANSHTDSDPWTRAKSYATLEALGRSHEVIASKAKVGKATVLAHIALFNVVSNYDDKRRDKAIEGLVDGSFSVKQIMEAEKLSEVEKLDAIDRMLSLKAMGLSARTKAKPASVVTGLNKSQVNGLIEEISKWDIKGHHGLAVKNAAIAALQCVTGAKESDTLADALNTLSKSKE